MHPKKKSYFAGGGVPIEQIQGSILYNRYTDPSELLLEPPQTLEANKSPILAEKPAKKRKIKDKGPAPTPPLSAQLAAEPVVIATKQRKKPRWSEERKESARKEREAAKASQKTTPTNGLDLEFEIEATPDEHPAQTEDHPVEDVKEQRQKKPKAAKTRTALPPEERVSGPSNAEEAQRIRSAMGFLGTPSSVQHAQQQAKDGHPNTFSFGFDATKAGIATEPAEQNGAPRQAVATSGDSSGGSDAVSDSDAEDASEGRHDAQGNSNDASKEDTSSDASDDTSSSGTSEDASESDSDSDSDCDCDDNENKRKDASEGNAVGRATANKTAQTTLPASATQEEAKPPAELDDAEYVPRRVYVGGMPYGYTESQVREFWEYCGPIESLDILTFPDTGRFRGIAFITFATEEGYKGALECDGEACDGQTVKVQQCKRPARDRKPLVPPSSGGGVEGKTERRDREDAAAVKQAEAPNAWPVSNSAAVMPTESKPPAPKTAGYHCAYVGNIAWEADEAAVKALFAAHGVTKVRLHTDKDTGKFRGFAHVHFKDEGSLDGAMELDGTLLMGRRIRVGYAQPKKQQAAS